MWLSRMQTPYHDTINTFRSEHLKVAINEIFTQVVLLLVEMGCLSLNAAYIDGTKIESRANRYSFVWRKSVEKNKAKLEAENPYNQPDDEPPTPINSEELKERIAKTNRERLSKEEKNRLKHWKKNIYKNYRNTKIILIY